MDEKIYVITKSNLSNLINNCTEFVYMDWLVNLFILLLIVERINSSEWLTVYTSATFHAQMI